MARLARSSSSNQEAIAARAALFHVWRLENPSSNSPIRLAASSATWFTARVVASSKLPDSRSSTAAARTLQIQRDSRSEERRVGKEGRSRWRAYHYEKKEESESTDGMYRKRGR